MRLLLIAVSLPLIVAADQSPKQPAPGKPGVARAICGPNSSMPANDGVADGTRVEHARPLEEMPPAKQQFSVIRTLDGCAVPTVIRENIGGN